MKGNHLYSFAICSGEEINENITKFRHFMNTVFTYQSCKNKGWSFHQSGVHDHRNPKIYIIFGIAQSGSTLLSTKAGFILKWSLVLRVANKVKNKICLFLSAKHFKDFHLSLHRTPYLSSSDEKKPQLISTCAVYGIFLLEICCRCPLEYRSFHRVRQIVFI